MAVTAAATERPYLEALPLPTRVEHDEILLPADPIADGWVAAPVEFRRMDNKIQQQMPDGAWYEVLDLGRPYHHEASGSRTEMNGYADYYTVFDEPFTLQDDHIYMLSFNSRLQWTQKGASVGTMAHITAMGTSMYLKITSTPGVLFTQALTLQSHGGSGQLNMTRFVSAPSAGIFNIKCEVLPGSTNMHFKCDAKLQLTELR